jgi:hypothetical protein
MTLSINCLLATLSINDTRYNNTAVLLIVANAEYHRLCFAMLYVAKLIFFMLWYKCIILFAQIFGNLKNLHHCYLVIAT